MKILYLHQHFSTPHGSTGTRSYEIARRLISEGHEVDIVCGSFDSASSGLNSKFKNGIRKGSFEGINITELKIEYSNTQSFFKRSASFLSYAFRTTYIALTYKYDLIFTTSTPLTAAIPGILAKWFRNKKFIFEVRDLWPELPRQMKVITNPFILKVLSIIEYLAYNTADKCIGLSPGITDGILKIRKDQNNVITIPNGCDIDLFNPIKQNDVNIDFENNFIALYAGTHGMANGLDYILEAAKYLKKSNEEGIKLVLIGNGMLKESLVAEAKRSQLNNVMFLDPLTKMELAHIMKKANLGIQSLKNVPSFYYGTSPNKFFDYIASGLPVIVNYPGWVKDLITEYKCGFYASENSPQDFAKCLIKAKKNQAKLKIMAENSINLAKTKFNRNNLAKEWISFVTESKL